MHASVFLCSYCPVLSAISPTNKGHNTFQSEGKHHLTSKQLFNTPARKKTNHNIVHTENTNIKRRGREGAWGGPSYDMGKKEEEKQKTVGGGWKTLQLGRCFPRGRSCCGAYSPSWALSSSPAAGAAPEDSPTCTAALRRQKKTHTKSPREVASEKNPRKRGVQRHAQVGRAQTKKKRPTDSICFFAPCKKNKNNMSSSEIDSLLKPTRENSRYP